MKVGDLVVATDYEWRDYGVGIIIGVGVGIIIGVGVGLKVFWSKEGVWSITSEGGVKQITVKKCP